MDELTDAGHDGSIMRALAARIHAFPWPGRANRAAITRDLTPFSLTRLGRMRALWRFRTLGGHRVRDRRDA
jgi:hypothetical protein